MSIGCSADVKAKTSTAEHEGRTTPLYCCSVLRRNAASILMTKQPELRLQWYKYKHNAKAHTTTAIARGTLKTFPVVPLCWGLCQQESAFTTRWLPSYFIQRKG